MIQALLDLYNILMASPLAVFAWIPFLWLLLWMFYKLKIIDNQGKWMAGIRWVFLEVRISEGNERSPLAMEQIFAALHAIHVNYTWGELFNGYQILWVSCEIVSIGGKVSYIVKIPERFRNLFESAIFAQYPKAEISEIEDYLGNLPHEYYPEEVEYDFWGTQFIKKKDNAYPIRTYKDFEHKEQETFIDPLANVIEVLSNIQPWELMAYQVVARPLNDKWKEHNKHILDKLKGAKVEHKEGFFDFFIAIPRFFADIAYGMFMEAEHSEAKVKDEPPTLMLHRSDVEKLVISQIENAQGKVSYEVKIRLLYLAPKDKLNRSLRVPEIIGAVRNFDDVNLNGLKPDLGHTWTNVSYKVSPTLEAPALRQQILLRKRHLWHYFMGRKIWQGVGQTNMNIEELATIYHLPVAPNVRVSQVEKVQTVKSAPPSDLPIG